MRITQRIFAYRRVVKGRVDRGRTLWIFLAAMGVVFLLFILVARQMRPAHQVAKRQASLIEGIERRSPARIQRLLSRNYKDRWGFTGEQIVESIVDAGSQFMALVVTPEEEEIRFDETGAAIVSVRLILSGKPVGPVGNEVTRRINQLAEPFRFEWRKENFLPSSWRLVRVENAALSDDLYGYEPGDIRRAMQGE